MRNLILMASLVLAAATARADDDHATAEQLGALVKGKRGNKVASKHGTLESPDFVDVSIKKGACYVVEVKLDPGARWKEGRRPAMFFPAWPTNPLTAGPSLRGDGGAVYEPSCAQKGGKLSFGLMTYGPDDKVGTGGFQLTVYERKGSAGELAKEASTSRKAHAEAIRERDASRGKTCGQCASESSSSSARHICLERRGMTMKDCGW